MKTIVYPDGSIEATVRADEFVATGKARYATASEDRSYNRAFERDDYPEASWERMAMEGDSGPSQPSCE